MKRKALLLIVVFSLGALANGATFDHKDKKQAKEQSWALSVEAYLQKIKRDTSLSISLPKTQLDTLYKKRGIQINFSEELAYHTLRKNEVEGIYDDIRQELGFSKFKRVQVNVDGLPLEQYVPVYYSKKRDKERVSKAYKGAVNVQNASQPFVVEQGLGQRHIALWNSHGRYYLHEEDQWKWQRAPLFTTVEDLFTSAYILPFLVPMLENAGANVYLPRERDVQTNEIIVDNDDEGFSCAGKMHVMSATGFKNKVALDSSTVNPFKMGTYGILEKDAVATWNGVIPANGNYAVYVSYVSVDKSSDEAEYEVHHPGGVTRYLVNQQMGGGTWIYLGNFFFDTDSPVKVTLKGTKKGKVTADAIRLGGGMGSIPRGGQVSGVPRWQEAARYYLQYAGALDSITFNCHGDSIDYNDDFRSRARWVNYLRGGESIEPALRNGAELKGLNIPIDVSLGVHTDAGHFPSMDSTVGTLAIYSTYDVAENRDFYDGKSRLSNRDLADMVQTQLVNDIRALHDDKWTKRELWDKMYSEATFAQCPSLLLELHGHANAQDMRYGLDPQFRFDASRAMYKGILRFLSSYYKDDYIVQPLPVAHMAIKQQDHKMILCWEPTKDALEPTAVPRSYVVYSRIDGQGWDNGTLVEGPTYDLNVTDTLLRSYKVTAVNDGGESFPSTVLSLVLQNDSLPTLLVVDGFTRVSAPFFMESGDSVGVAPWEDEGVPWGLDLATIGWQYNYDQRDPWQSDDIPGHGASYDDLSDSVFVGNRFDNSYTHVSAIAKAGYNVVSTSMGAVEKGLVNLSSYDAVDFAFGEQRTTVLPSGKVKFAIYTPKMMLAVRNYLKDDEARLLISGAHIANDVLVDTSAQLMGERKRFVNQSLGFEFGGQMKVGYDAIFLKDDTLRFHYNTDYSLEQYRVENADVLLPSTEASVKLTYMKNEGAVIFYHPSYKVLSSGVPFEAIKGKEDRQTLMEYYLEYLFNE
ncbi:MAG: xanthan lyase [Bacteroidales bacterium]|jgi:hypothetical protein|nr:xanthan lyase [Bacteroidales bacterium]